MRRINVNNPEELKKFKQEIHGFVSSYGFPYRLDDLTDKGANYTVFCPLRWKSAFSPAKLCKMLRKDVDADKITVEYIDFVKETELSHQKVTKISDQEEPVSEELEEAAEEWDESLYRSDAFKAGAKWQRQQDEHLIWQISSANYEKGKLEGKNQTISKAYEWLDKNIEKYISADGEWDINWCIMNDFRKSLEE